MALAVGAIDWRRSTPPARCAAPSWNLLVRACKQAGRLALCQKCCPVDRRGCGCCFALRTCRD